MIIHRMMVTLNELSKCVMVAMPMEPSEHFLSLNCMTWEGAREAATLLRRLRLLAVLARDADALFT